MKNEVILRDTGENCWLRFTDPVEIIQAFSVDEVMPALREINHYVTHRRRYAAGFLSYEAAPAFDDAHMTHEVKEFPLLWFGIYNRPEEINLPPSYERKKFTLGKWNPSISEEQYQEAFTQIKKEIKRGETYQVNYSYRLHTGFSGDPREFFLQLKSAQQAEYACFVHTGRFAVCSASPELFFRLSGEQLITKPMKGTSPRGRITVEDDKLARWLYQSEKNRAENLMIVDMIRNDLGRVADFGSVNVSDLYHIEKYPTLFQMTSTVTACTDAEIPEIFTALFPSASITGAPKSRTMEIIKRLESGSRGIYTGSAGFVAPGRIAQFNVAIRTVSIDMDTNTAEYGTGGGVVWDSDCGDEYNESLLKAKVLTREQPDFSLLETVLWTAEQGYFLLEYHLNRLEDSAIYFDFPIQLDDVLSVLQQKSRGFTGVRYKVRITVSREGKVVCETEQLPESSESQDVRIHLAATPIDPEDPFLYHKTTHRFVYQKFRAEFPEYDDVLLWNPDKQVTEGTIANVVVRLRGELITPPVECGLLPGTFRAWLLEQQTIQERELTVDDLRECSEIYLVNSVRKWQRANLE